MSEAPDRAAKRTAAGCLAAGALFAVVFIAVWLAAITLYGLVVEQWEMVSVRHEFGYEWAFLYAPLIAFGLGTLALGFAAYQIYEHWEPIKAWFKGLWDSVVGIFQSALAEVKSLIGAPLDYMEAKLGKVMDLLGVKKSSPEAQAAADAQAGLGQTAASHGTTPSDFE